MLFYPACNRRGVSVVQMDTLPSKEIGDQEYIPEVSKDLYMGIEIRAVGRRGDEAAAAIPAVSRVCS